MVDREGRIFIAWVDGRDADAAKARRERYAGSATYYAVSDDGGAQFKGDYKHDGRVRQALPDRCAVRLVTIATDPADDQEATALIRKKLAKSGLQAETWAFGPAPADQLRHAIDPTWRSEMPRSYWFDGDGQVRAYSGLITAERVAAMLPK